MAPGDGLAVHLLGRPRVERPDTDVYQFRSRKSWAVLAYLALSERPPTRSRLATLLFAGADDPLRALRWCLGEIRRCLGDDGAVDGNPVVLRLPGDAVLDVDVVAHGAWTDAIHVPGLGEELLDGLTFRGAPAFESWLLSHRRRLAAAAETILREAALGAMSQGDVGVASGYAVRAAAMSPLDEDHQALLIRLYRLSGDDDGAERQFASFASTLTSELGVDPGAAIEAAMRQRSRPERAADGAAAGGAPATPIVGRVRERLQLGGAIAGAAEMRPCAVLVHGESGVGKTSLVARACADAELQGYAVLWGSCVHFGAAASPYAPVFNALERWLASGAAGDEDGNVPRLLDDLRSEGAAGAGGRRQRELERVLAGIGTGAPSILVVDDLQWADESSLDLLAYLVAGFHRQRLAIVVTYRDDELEDGHPLHGWLADLARMPAVRDLPLSRLTEDETADQVALLMGGMPAEGLVRDVHTRSGGNAYLSELLVQNLGPGAERLPPGLPDRLQNALRAAWHRLSAPTRDLLKVFAVGGEPLEYAELVSVAETVGMDPRGVAASVEEAAAAGVIVAEPSTMYWFRHPLLAEVLSESLMPDEAERLHAAYVEVLESTVGCLGPDRVRRLAILALHHERVGDHAAAFDYLLDAADEARLAQGYPEEARHLYRLVELSDRAGPAALATAGGLVALLERAADAARHGGDLETGYDLATRALACVDRVADPLTAARLLVVWTLMAFQSGRSSTRPVPELAEAVELSSVTADSAEHAVALAHLARAEVWASRWPDAERHAELAVQAAGRCGVASAMSLALGARSFAHMREKGAAQDIEDAYEWGRRSGDAFVLGHACIDRTNHLGERGRLSEQVPVLAEGFAIATAAGVRVFAATLAGMAAGTLLDLGRIEESRAWVREALAARAPGVGGVFARRAAAILAVRTGRLDEAAHHVDRLQELIPSVVDQVGRQVPTTLAEHLLSQGRAEDAIQVVRRGLPVHGAADGRYADQLLVWGARAVADAVGQAVDRSDTEARERAEAALDELTLLREACVGVPFESVEGDAVQPALRALFLAESARCHRGNGAATAWRHAATACRAAGLRWEEGVAGTRWAEALLAARASRAEAAAVLRSTHALVTEMGALPLGRELAAMARSARISLEQPAVPAARPGSDEPLAALTARETEVLAHLVTGRSYAEIADSLFISQKTVSVHVSNLLRKTGARNRAEAAAFGRRHGLSGTA